MANLKLTELNKATTLLRKLVDKADINKDGAIRAGDVEKIRSQPGVGNPRRQMGLNETQALCLALDAFRHSAASQGGPTTENIRTLLGETKEKLKLRDRDGDGVLAPGERPRSLSAPETALLLFADACKGLSVSDFTLPAARDHAPPRFSWRGTPDKVCQSLLDAFNKTANDNAWPAWARPDGGPRAARYVVTGDEATAMVDALRPLFPERQKAVLNELARRTQRSVYGCVAPDADGKRVLRAFARELGLSLQLGSPAAPRMPSG